MSKGDGVVVPLEVGTQKWKRTVGDFVLKFKSEAERRGALREKIRKEKRRVKKAENFSEGCLIPMEDRERFARMAHAKNKTLYELCPHKEYCPAENKCQHLEKDLLASPCEDTKSRVPVISPY